MMQTFSGSGEEWNRIILGLPDPHFLQTWEWAQIKSQFGWTSQPLIWIAKSGSVTAACMVLKRQVISRGFAARLSILYAPKGPLMNWDDATLRMRVLTDIQGFAHSQGAVFLKIDPEVRVGTGLPGEQDDLDYPAGQFVLSDLVQLGWMESKDQVQFRNTVLIDLTPSSEQLLAQMKQKTRYNIRLAGRKGVSVRMGNLDDMRMLYRMYANTSVRDGFVIRDEGYYMAVWRTFMLSRQPTMLPLVAEVEGKAVAGLMLFLFGARAYYVYGMSTEEHREKMPTYLLQWEAIKIAKSRGCDRYDLWGAPEVFNEHDPLWGVFRFKDGLGGKVVRTLGAFDFAPNPLWYKMYSEVMPRVLDLMRLRGRQQTRQIVGGA